jgi:hypothetical protein
LSSELYGTAPEIVSQVQPHRRTVPPVRLDLKAADVYSLGCSIKQLLNREPFKLHKSDETGDGPLKQGGVLCASEVGGGAESSGTVFPGQFGGVESGLAGHWETSPEFAMFNLLESRLDQALPSVDAMMEGVSEGVPRPCVEIVRACLLSAPERPSPEDVAEVFQKAYDDTITMDSFRVNISLSDNTLPGLFAQTM